MIRLDSLVGHVKGTTIAWLTEDHYFAPGYIGIRAYDEYDNLLYDRGVTYAYEGRSDKCRGSI